MPERAADDHMSYLEAARAGEVLAEHVDVVEAALDDIEHRGVTRGTGG